MTSKILALQMLVAGAFLTSVFTSSEYALAAEPQTVESALTSAGIKKDDHGAFCAECQKSKGANTSTEEGKKAKEEADRKIAEILKRNGVTDSAKALQAGGMNKDQAATFKSPGDSSTQMPSLAAVQSGVVATTVKDVELSKDTLAALSGEGRHKSR